ncbi:MAG: hypothetical protein CL505_04635 [Actinobacteria bacterium]|nr:hypothetical protein [Actinomycetota bacterium]
MSTRPDAPTDHRAQPTLQPVRRSRFLTLLPAALTITAVTAGIVAAGPYDEEIAASLEQIDTHHEAIAASHDQIADLREELLVIDDRIAAAEAVLVAGDDALLLLPVQMELLADEFVDIVFSRNEPAILRHKMAIDSYVRNNDRLNAVLNQSSQMAQQALEDARNRLLYDSVIELALSRLEVVDARLRLAADKIDGMRGTIAEAEDRQRESVDRLEAEQAEIPLVEARIVEVRNQITEFEAQIKGIEEEIARLEKMSITTKWTGLQGTDVGRPVLAVKIDNVTRAHPQAGINQADVVYEELVEAGISRLIAVFQSTDAPVVGPVRSARTSDPPLLTGYDRPLFAYSGANRGTQESVDASPLVDVGHDSASSHFWRSTDRRAPHNLFTSTAGLWGLHPERTSVPPEPFSFRFEGEALHDAAEPAAGVFIDFGRTEVDYEWNGSGWQRTHNGEPHVDDQGLRVAPPNMVVMFTEYGTSFADSRSPEAITSGSGQAWVFTEGQIIRGEWRRTDSDLPARLTVGGEPIHLTPGRTWVALAPPDSAAWR